MKSRWKKYLAAGLVLSGMLSLTGCHGAKEEKNFVIPDTFDTAKNHEITFWAKNDTNKTQTDIYKKAIADFEAMYPNITVNLKLYTDYGKIYMMLSPTLPRIQPQMSVSPIRITLPHI